MQGSISLLVLNVIAGGALAVARFVTPAGAYPAAGGAAHGVTRTSADAAGDLVPVDVLGTAIVESGGVVTNGGPVKVDNTGRVVDHDSTNVKVARALNGATGAGQMVEVLLIPNA